MSLPVIARRIIPIFAATVFLMPSVALAQANGINLETLRVPIIPGGDFFGILVGLINLFLLVAGIVAFLYILWAGFNYLSAGGDDGKVKVARQTILNAIIGIIIIAISFILVNFVVNRIRAAGGVTNTTTNPEPAVRPRRGTGN